MLIPGRLRSRLIFCVMFRMAQERQGAASRRRPLYPRAPAGPRCASFDLSLQAAGRAEEQRPCKTRPIAHPCGLPLSSGTSQRF